ncbi:MAG: hypothetical protein L0G09_15360 [Acinetobacter sp.]|nr:hypothetical protein [Acinetobacter sp.]MDN5433464.1 hypothetical protein [Acinetobacter sp.]MDN5622724.1 hypothetical protein [Acinetobacter sp.]MDN5650921.1 hypothetical protein [Acinetobacter sp.]MDN5690922.1 hypothetical protein [Acinetobacter sp.]
MNAVAEKLSNLEWMGQQMRAKTANYEISTASTGGDAPNWEDRCGAIASIEDQATKAYCELLVWGDYRDNTMAYHTLHHHLAAILYEALAKDVQRIRFDLKSFAFKVAKMALFFNLRSVNEFNTENKLKFFGITEMKMRTYREHYVYLENMVEIILEDMKDEIDFYADIYRKNMRKA